MNVSHSKVQPNIVVMLRRSEAFRTATRIPLDDREKRRNNRQDWQDPNQVLKITANSKHRDYKRCIQ
jgi:hypothetical protein